LITADGHLLQIPFGVLADPAETKAQPLLVNHEIVSLPSASVIAVQRLEWAKRKPAAKQLALFTDPVFEQDDERVTSKTRPEAVNVSLDRAITDAAIGGDRSRLHRLPFSRSEADAILAFTRRDDSLKALDFTASKKVALGEDLGRYRIVHFATHALLNNDHPELSGIVLSLADRQGRSVDGFLRLNEIYNLNLSADLVVLSACETGLGKQIKEEGSIGLSRGFMGAGAQRVVSSLWKVDDEATAQLMGRFYEKMLKEGEAVPAALRHAQLAMSQEERWRGAYFCAGFQMAGEWK
jgi:CHAT domain-containing protein